MSRQDERPFGENVNRKGCADVIADGLAGQPVEEAEEMIRDLLRDHDCSIVERHVEKFDGPSRGGPTYRLIFLRCRG